MWSRAPRACLKGVPDSLAHSEALQNLVRRSTPLKWQRNRHTQMASDRNLAVFKMASTCRSSCRKERIHARNNRNTRSRNRLQNQSLSFFRSKFRCTTNLPGEVRRHSKKAVPADPQRQISLHPQTSRVSPHSTCTTWHDRHEVRRDKFTASPLVTAPPAQSWPSLCPP